VNAVDAVGEAGRVAIVAHDAGPRGVSVAVTDDGPGIAPEHLERIFDPLFTTKAHGTGLGLGLARAIVRAHGGGLAAGAVAPRRARVEITLPRAPGTDAAGTGGATT
jgi:two-component system NtrC family sensor kinase